MPGPTIKFVIDGLAEDEGHVRAHAFIEGFQAFVAAIRKTEHLVTGTSGRSSFYLRVVSLTHSSPATAELEAVAETGAEELTASVLDEVLPLLRAVEQGNLEEHGIDSGFLTTLRELTAPVGSKVGSVRIERGTDVVEITPAFTEGIDLVLAGETSCDGELSGYFEYLNIHQGQNVFRIYPEAGPRKVTCHFSDELRDQAISAVGSYVNVQGRLLFRTMDYHPYAIQVREIEVVPPDAELPGLMEISGIAPGLTRGIPSEVFVRSIRDAQEL